MSARLGACRDCHDWLVAGKTAPVPRRCDFCKRRRAYAYHREWQRSYRAAERDRVNARKRELYAQNRARYRASAKVRYDRLGTDEQRRLGVSQDEYRRRLAEQGGVCAICGEPPGRVRLHLDHDHGSGAVRGLLCAACNRGIGSLRDDPAILRAALEYLA